MGSGKSVISEQTTTNERETAGSIFRVARDLFYENGYCNVTTRTIAQRAYVNRGLITYYYSSKEVLGNQICLEINNWMFQEALKHKLSVNATSAERLYAYSILAWRAFNLPENAVRRRFYFEFMHSTSTMEPPSAYFMKISAEVIRDYHLHVTDAQQALYCTIMKGAERLLSIKLHRHELDITTDDIVKSIVSGYFFNIGISSTAIKKIIKHGDQMVAERS